MLSDFFLSSEAANRFSFIPQRLSVQKSDKDVSGNVLEDVVCTSILEDLGQHDLSLLVLGFETFGETRDQGILDDGLERILVGEEVDKFHKEETLVFVERVVVVSVVVVVGDLVAKGILDSGARATVTDPVGQEVKNRGVDIVVIVSELGTLVDFNLAVLDTGRLCYGLELDLGDMGH